MTRIADADGFFLLRTPLLAFDTLAACSADAEAPRADADALGGALARDRRAFEERLRDILARPEVRDALRLATPDLEQRLRPWLDEGARPNAKLVRAGLRYAARICARPTPFGLMAGTALGTLGSRTALELGPHADARRRTTIEPHFVTALAETLSSDADVRRHLRLRPSTSLYEAGGRWRYARARTDGARRRYELVAADGGAPLRAVIDRARDGAALDQLVGALVERGAAEGAATDYVTALIDAQILEGDLVPPVTGTEPAAALVGRLAAIPGTEDAARGVETARAALQRVDAGGLGAPADAYDGVTAALGALPVDLDPARSLVAELVMPVARAELGRDVVAEVARVTELLAALIPRRREDPLARWRAAFHARWEEQEVPLMEALDEELGIGYQASQSPSAEGSPLLRGLPWPPGEEQAARFSPRDRHMLARLLQTVAAGERELRLDSDDLAALRPDQAAELPDAFAALVTVADAGDGFRVRLHGVAGPSGARLVGRVCHAVPGLADAVRGHLRREEALRPDAVFAEVVHLPEGRTGKLIARPVLRDHELAYLGRSGAPAEAVLDPSDLMVSVRGERIVLRSRRLGREVIPRLASALNYTNNSLGLFNFVCSLQGQDCAEGVAWTWGVLATAPFLPRVVAGRTVLERARWLVTAGELADAVAARDDAQRWRALAELRERRGLPRWVALAEGDNELALDLDAAVAQDTLVRLAATRPAVRLVELWPAPEDLSVRGPGGRYANELIVPFTRAKTGTGTFLAPPAPRAAVAAPRRFLPGGEWVYAQLYTGTATADGLLSDTIAPLVRDALGSGTADRWFFLRYSDPDHHLRVRLRGDPARLLPALHAAAASELERGRLWRLTLDTYERELERYGGAAGVELCEDVFHADSDAALELLELYGGDAGADTRWRLALAGIDRLLGDLLTDEDAKHAVIRAQRHGYAAEHRADAELRGAVGERFRDEREALAPLVEWSEGGAAPEPLAAGLAVLERRSEATAEPFARLRVLADDGELETPLHEIAASLAHMHANRLLRSAQRAHEMVIYDVLDRLHTARAARARS